MKVGLRILVVEDEAMIAFFIEDCLQKLGHTIIGPAARVSTALVLARTEAIDLALLDVNIAGEEVYPVADELKARGVPFVFLSGYGLRGLKGAWADSPFLVKPFAAEALAQAASNAVLA